MNILLTALFSTLLSTSLFALDISDKAPQINLQGHPMAVDMAKLQKGKSKFIVLEWYNEGCPFVRKHYDSGNIPNMQKMYKDKLAWLTIASSVKGKQGHIKDIAAASELYTKEQMSALSLLLDKGGKVGKSYDAKTTPHFYIINPQGELVYQGAIDSIPSADPADIAEARNHVSAALSELFSGKEVSMAKTRAYGCSVKY